jgi:hypothetical protein
VVSGPSSVVAVIDSSGSDQIIWWVDVATQMEGNFGRLCGAWVLPLEDVQTLPLLIQGRLLLPTLAGREVLLNHPLFDPRSVVDLRATLDLIVTIREQLQNEFDSLQAERIPSKRLTDITWPIFPEAPDLEDASFAIGPLEVGKALGISRWVESLAVGWAGLEGTRVLRKGLRKLGGSEPRQLPFQFLGA